ncbi:unnamed protein product, partial [Didymodactylos carnosus]
MFITRPRDIEVIETDSNEKCFNTCIEKGREWIRWFDRFIDVFEYPLEWFNCHNVDGARQLFIDLNSIKDNSTTTLIQMETIVEKILKLLRPLNDLPRLCHLFNCLTPFQIIEHGTTDGTYDWKKFILDLKRSEQNNNFTIGANVSGGKAFSISSRQNVHWSIASEKHACNIKMEYQVNGLKDNCHLLFSKENVPVDRRILGGEFETQKSGQLLVTIDNESGYASRTIWLRIKSTNLSRCHLFDGIFNIIHQAYSTQSVRTIKGGQLNPLLDKAFSFIDKLLTGTISLREMVDLKAVFCNKNINVEDEVRRLFTNRSDAELLNQQRAKKLSSTNANPLNNDIKLVCEWLQTYQYYSHINNIIDCIETFDILTKNNNDESIDTLKRLCGNENCTLREITQVHKTLQQRLKHLSGSHLQLIKTMLECSGVVQMIKKRQLYSTEGQHRFQELRDNLTTQFQLQERNNMILNSLIITYVLCEPFAMKAKTFEEFVDRVARLSNVDDNSLKHIK